MEVITDLVNLKQAVEVVVRRLADLSESIADLERGLSASEGMSK